MRKRKLTPKTGWNRAFWSLQRKWKR